jgi:hypothetical protein
MHCHNLPNVFGNREHVNNRRPLAAPYMRAFDIGVSHGMPWAWSSASSTWRPAGVSG